MSGIKTDLRNIGSAFEKMKALQAAEQRKKAVINELVTGFMRAGFDQQKAREMAERQYNRIHSNLSI
jgi:hypothetical protein